MGAYLSQPHGIDETVPESKTEGISAYLGEKVSTLLITHEPLIPSYGNADDTSQIPSTRPILAHSHPWRQRLERSHVHDSSKEFKTSKIKTSKTRLGKPMMAQKEPVGTAANDVGLHGLQHVVLRPSEAEAEDLCCLRSDRKYSAA